MYTSELSPSSSTTLQCTGVLLPLVHAYTEPPFRLHSSALKSFLIVYFRQLCCFTTILLPMVNATAGPSLHCSIILCLFNGFASLYPINYNLNNLYKDFDTMYSSTLIVLHIWTVYYILNIKKWSNI